MKHPLSALLALIVALSQVLTHTLAAAQLFPDIRSPQLREAVEYLHEKAVIQGYSDGSFRPDQTINRAEALKIIYESQGITPLRAAETSFPDVPNSEWFSSYVFQAKRQGIVQGYPDGNFRPAQQVNRVEFIKMAMTALPFFRADVDAAAVGQQYADIDHRAWYVPHLAFGQRFGFLDQAVKLRPDDAMTRGDAALIIARMANMYERLSCLPRCEELDEELLILVEDFEINLSPAFDPQRYRQADQILQQLLAERGLVERGFTLRMTEQDRESFDGVVTTFTRAALFYQGIPVDGGEVLVEWEGEGDNLQAEGDLFPFIDLTNVIPELSAEGALAMAKDDHGHRYQYLAAGAQYDHEESELVVFPFREEESATLAYQVSFSVHALSSAVLPESWQDFLPRYVIDADSGHIIQQWDDLQTFAGHGPGGNEKIGQHIYGQDRDPLDVNKRGKICRLENRHVRTTDGEAPTFNARRAHPFPCFVNEVREVNGAFSPLNDAHAYANVVYDLYREWFGKGPFGNRKMVLKVHHRDDPRQSYPNASWRAKENLLVFGDGNELYFPFSTDPGIMAHEIGHAFTSANSGLLYSGMSGGMNEAYSDMVAMAVEYYLTGSNSWELGTGIVRGELALRYFDDPTLDGRSIDHADDFTDDLNVHHSSGVYNKAFHLLATTAGWDTKMAFEVMTVANDRYWKKLSSFNLGACGAERAARKLKYAVADVREAFAKVGVSCALARADRLITPAELPIRDQIFDALPAEGSFPETPEPFAVESITTTHPGPDRISQIVVTGRGFPRSMQAQAEECDLLHLDYRSGEEFRFSCVLKQSPRLSLVLLDEQRQELLYQKEFSIVEVYRALAQIMSARELRVEVEGVNIENATITSPSCASFEIDDQDTSLLSARCRLPDGPVPRTLPLSITSGELLLFEEEVAVQAP